MSSDISHSNLNTPEHSRWSWFLIGLPLVVWCYYLLTYSVNIPWFDDLDPFSDFIRQWSQHPDFSERLELLFRPNNEHRMIFGKLAALLYYLVTGELNFTFLHLAGALFYLGSFVLCWQIFRLLRLPTFYFIPVSFLFFQLKTHLVFLWAVCSLQHQPIVFFVGLTLFFLAKEKYKAALLTGLCATFSMSNGMLVWAAGGLLIVYRNHWKQLTLWCLTGGAAILAYFSGMTTQNNESSFTYLVQHPHLTPLGFFTFLGGLFDIFPINQPIQLRSALPVIFGALLSGWSIWFLLRNFPGFQQIFRKHPSRLSTGSSEENNTRVVHDFVLGVLVFSLINALIIGVLRPRFGFFVFLLSNYKLYTFIFATTVYLGFLLSTKNRQWRQRGAMVFGVASFLIWCFSIITETPVINERRKFLLINAYNQEHNGFGLGFAPNTPAAFFLDTLMQDIRNAGIYEYPKEYDHYFQMMKDPAGAIVAPAEFSLDRKSGETLIMQQNTLSGLNSRTDVTIAFARSQERLYVFPMSQSGYSGKNPFRQYERTKYAAIPYQYLTPGEYDLGVFEIIEGDGRKYDLGKLFSSERRE